MKKETISTFSEGLNYDLNPITTPNNVLTENINGTFITFNGDELALQNDAGNTKILVPGTTDEYVQLSNGFYPIGIKEYGGVLYIVSTNGNYIEFGSYPSPEFITGSYNQGNIYDSSLNDINSMLYAPKIVNKLEFKSGSYITFARNGYNLEKPTYISRILTTKTKIKGIYVVKLWHQLSNGFIDLTDDVWIKFNTYRRPAILQAIKDEANDPNKTITVEEEETYDENHPNFWFLDPNFKYYCPNQYRGKLAISLELESLDKFEFYDYSSVKFTQDTKLVVNDITGLSSGWVKINDTFYNYTGITGTELNLDIPTYPDAKINDVVYKVTISAGTTSTEILDSGIYFEIPINDGNLITSTSKEIIIGDKEIFKYDDIVNNILIFNNGIELKNSYPINTEIKNISVETESTKKLTEDFGSYYTVYGNLTWSNIGPIEIIGADIIWKYNGLKIGQSSITAKYDSNNPSALLEQQPYSFNFSSNIYEEKVITYEITPILKIDGLEYGLSKVESLPDNYINQYTLFNERILSTTFSNTVFELFDIPDTQFCDTTNIGYRTYPIVILKNTSGQYINAEGDVVSIPNIFKLDTYSLPETLEGKPILPGDLGECVVLLTYTRNLNSNGYPSIHENIENVPADLIDMFTSTVQIYKYSSFCDKITLSIKTNKNARLTIKQNGVTIGMIDTNPNTFTKIQISPTIGVSIYYDSIVLLIRGIYTSDKSLNLAIVESFDISTIDNYPANLRYESTIWWYIGSDLSQNIQIKINNSPGTMTYNDYKYKVIYSSKTNNPLNISLSTASFEQVSNSDYNNFIESSSNFVRLIGTNYIFNETYSLPQIVDTNLYL